MDSVKGLGILIGAALIIFGIIAAAYGLVILAIILIVVGLIVVIYSIFFLFIPFLAARTARAFLGTAEPRNDDEELREWAIDVLERTKPLLDKLLNALRERHDRKRVISDTKDIVIQLLERVKEKISGFIDKSGAGTFGGSVLKRWLERAIEDALKRLRTI